MPNVGELYLYIKRSATASVQTFHFPIVDQIAEDITVTLSELPTVVFGFRNRFDMDLGTVQKFSIKVSRVNPFPWGDSSSDCDRWSNGHFYTELLDAIDFWQNFAYNSQGKYTGGFTMSFVSADESLYPSFSKNVFLSGQFTPDYSVQKMTFTLPLVVSSMDGSGAQVDTATVTLHANNGTSETETVEIPINFDYPVPDYPTDWTNDYMSMVGWDTSPAGSTVVYRAGESFVVQGDMDLYAVWQRPFAYHVWNSSTVDDEWTVPMNAATMTVIMVGGGGCGGRGYSTSYSGSDSYRTYRVPGGAGGSGYVASGSYTVYPGGTLRFSIGQPGHWDGDTKVNPTESILYYNEAVLTRAKPGENGYDTSETDLTEGRGGLGGQYDCVGGHSNYVAGSTMFDDFKGTDGGQRDGLGVPGQGAEATSGGTAVFRHLIAGGGGGAAAAFDVRIQIEGSPGYHSIASAGGNGFTLDYNDAPVTSNGNNGVNGGGGGAGIRSMDSAGADPGMDARGADGGYGACVVMFFRQVT